MTAVQSGSCPFCYMDRDPDSGDQQSYLCGSKHLEGGGVYPIQRSWRCCYESERVVADQDLPTHEQQWKDSWNGLAQYIHYWARRKGFWDETPRNNSEMLMLIVTELAEACEALRHGNPPDDKVPAFSGIEAELADAVIRIMDMSFGRGWRVAEAIAEKMAYNEGRPYRHGKQF